MTILSKVTLGHNVTIHAGTVIGGEGFGYFWDGQQQKKLLGGGVIVKTMMSGNRLQRLYR
ncbi:MAG: hypothetical protein H0A75_00615 [Candidatus Methanofishera endochildressiae]|uniref:Uncharacterized protein n=1 Tax=Candidatus Methanofishera endochildressiae TaxID=2738884 RepID=A0A7Z0MN38_9GAMM|nr:hypothetical protein [Candidatus Methanofishera endochildressiae]